MAKQLNLGDYPRGSMLDCDGGRGVGLRSGVWSMVPTHQAARSQESCQRLLCYGDLS